MKLLKGCRLGCKSELVVMIDLGVQAYSGIFPDPEQGAECDLLQLVQCTECKLVQLDGEPDLNKLYGPTYGYRSGLNATMVNHLKSKVQRLYHRAHVHGADVVLDIGSSDGTLLNAWKDLVPGLDAAGFDPQAERFKDHYNQDIIRFPQFFNFAAYGVLGKKAKVITAIAMFYDLPDPVQFLKDVKGCLADDGIIHLEFTPLDRLFKSGGFDSICHEHLEYYGLTQIRQIAKMADLVITYVDWNQSNGGSVEVDLQHSGEQFWDLDNLCHDELTSLNDAAWAQFRNRATDSAVRLTSFLASVDKGSVALLGASTKGNVLLQYAGIDRTMVDAAVDVNPEKWGKVTPGSNIPIISEEVARLKRYDYYVVMPWHFRESIIAREEEFLKRGGRLIFPLPQFEIVTSHEAHS